MTDQVFRDQLARDLFNLAASFVKDGDIATLAPLWLKSADLIREAGSSAAGAVAVTVAALRSREGETPDTVFLAFHEAARTIQPEPWVMPSVTPCPPGPRGSGRFD